MSDDKKKVEQVVEGPAKKKKKSGLAKFIDTFVEDDAASVKQYVVEDVLIPGFKDILYDTVTNSLNRFLYNDREAPRRNNGGNVTSFTRYTGRYQQNNRSNTRETRPLRNGGYSFDNVVVPSRGEAQEVLDSLGELLSEYGTVSVADLYDMCGLQTKHTDNNYGWESLNGFSIKRYSSTEYEILTPRPIVI